MSDDVQAAIADRIRQALEAGPGTPAWAREISGSVSLFAEAARLQGGSTYHSPEGGLSCDLAADAGDVHHRIGVWQQTLARVEGRDPLPGGIALRFPFDVDLAATLARLAAAEYRCCSFGSYTLVVDATGLRLEIRMPPAAEATLAAIVGTA